MKIYPIDGERWRVHVASRRPMVPPHLVDLEENESNGACGCEHFRIRLAKLLQEFGNWPRRRCAHIKAARDFVLDREMRMHQQQESAGTKAAAQVRAAANKHSAPERQRLIARGMDIIKGKP